MDINFLETDHGKVLDDILSLLNQATSSPLYPGDERRVFGEALAMVINTMFQTINDRSRQRLLRYARGEVLDALGENRGVSRIQPSKAETVLCFSLSAPATSNLILPAGIRVTGKSGYYFITTQTVVLPAGLTSINIPAQSSDGGSQFNGIEAGELNVLVDTAEVPQVSEVKNLTITMGGGNIEDDDTYRERIRTAENRLSCGTQTSYLYWTLSANAKIVDANISTGEELIQTTKPIEDGKIFLNGIGILEGTIKADVNFALTRDTDDLITLTTSSTAKEAHISFTRKRDGVVVVRPILAGGEIPDEEILEDVREVLLKPEVKPLTDYIEVVAPTPIYYDIEIEYWTSLLQEAEIVKAIEGVGGAVQDYVLWQDSAMDQDINPDQLLRRILCPHDGRIGAMRAKVIKPEYTELKSTEVAKWSGKLTARHQVKGR